MAEQAEAGPWVGFCRFWIQVLRFGSRHAIEPRMSTQLPHPKPYTIHQEPERLIITIHRDAGDSNALVSAESYEWISKLSGEVVLDFSQVATVNSLLVAWLFHLVQAGRLTSLVVRRANQTVIKQMKQFYLDRFVTLSYDR